MQETVNTNTNPSNNNQAHSELWNLTIRDLFFKYIRFLPLFVLCVALALFGAYAYLRYATPIYSTNATMVISSDQAPGARNDKFEEIFGEGKKVNIQSEIEVLKSKALMARVVQKQDLQFSYAVKGKIKTINIYKYGPFLIEADQLRDSNSSFILKIRVLNEEQFRVNDETTPIRFNETFKNALGTFRLVRRPGTTLSKDYTVSYQPLAAAAAEFSRAIMVAPKVAGTGILSISMQNTNPNLAADVVNQLMVEYGDYTKELKNQTSDQTIAFIDSRMEVLGRELDSVQNNLLRYAQDNNLIDAEAQTSAYFDNLSSSDKAINEQQLQLNTAEYIEIYLRDKKNSYGPVIVPSSLGLNDPTLNELVNAYNTMQIERQQLLDGNVPAENPAVKEASEQIEKLRISLLENLSNIKNSMRKTIASLRQSGGLAEGQLKAMPYKLKGYLELKKQVDNKQALYNILQEKREQTAISRAANVANSQVVENAYVSFKPIKPNRRSIQLMAILIGLAIPALFVFVSEMLNDKVTTRYDVEKITSAPILGEIGHSYSETVLLVGKTNRSMVAEQFRIIRSNLQYVIGKAEKFVLLITSSYSGEGKSFISTNVGGVMALAGRKTIILEFDIRKPKLISGLNMPKGPGITNFLIGNSALPDLIKLVPGHENLFVLPCGPIPPNPSELLLGDKTDELFDWLRKEFDVVIIDTAPVGMVSDAQTLSKYADATLYIVRQGHTFKKQITLIEEFYQFKKLPKVSVVINDVKMKAGYGYYGYGRYGYGYGYGQDSSYYEEETAPDNFFERLLHKLSKLNPFRK